MKDLSMKIAMASANAVEKDARGTLQNADQLSSAGEERNRNPPKGKRNAGRKWMEEIS
ncbi:hypothetical protein K3495_g16706 [Podosphaera aphanis]|nr:hypothetical protein K3495_g16706 [Podosphaera aphanis]